MSDPMASSVPTLGIERPVPSPDLDSQPYWDATREHRLVLQRCASCSQFWFYPRARCPHCWSPDFTWEEVSGLGTVYSFTVIRRAPTPAFTPAVPYVVALIDLDEGPRVMSNVLGLDVADVRIDLRVRVAWEDIGDGLALPVFVPAEDAPRP